MKTLVDCYSGFRLRPLGIGRFRPYAGMAAAGLILAGTSADGSADNLLQGAWGPRLGVDVSFLNGMLLLGVEAVVYRLLDPDEGFLYGQTDGPWAPWGGLRFAFVR